MKKVIIIGAGAAGIACGRVLSKNAKLEVLYLEGRNRVSGRCVTMMFGTGKQYPVDIGACWIEGLRGNPISDLAKEHGFSIVGGRGGNGMYDFDGSGVSDRAFTSAKKKYYGVYREAKSAGKKLRGPDVPLEVLMKKREKDRKITYTDEERRIKDYILSGTEQFNGGQIKEFSAKHFGSGPEFNGGEGYVKEGIGLLLEKEFKKLNIPIQFNTTVTKINYEGNEKVFIETNNGTMEADYVVCTVPLGVLKEKLIEFTPQLPENKNENINHLGYGLMNKLVMVFPTKFWKDEDDARFGYVDKDTKARWRFWVSLSSWHQNDRECAVLISLMTCDFAKYLETLSQEEVVEDAMKVLRTIFEKNKGIRVPEPVNSHVSYWQKDEFSKGGYSFLAVNSSTQSCRVLSKELNRLHFAGEHTSQYYSAVHGAWLSGVREAKKILVKIGMKREEIES